MLHQKFYKIFLSACVVAMLFSCKKEKFTPIDINSLNPDTATHNTALDQWLKTTFLDEYNINVIYHNNVYYHEADRNVTPPDPTTVQPMMTTVLDGFIMPYRKVAGVNFIKQNVPKEFVLFGSTSYDAQNTGYAGTAAGGVRVNLFGLDFYSPDPGFATGRLGVIHHEFTHIVNQIFPMPADFASITAAHYNADWTNTSEDTSHKYGFVSSYASQNPVEDFAEMGRSLLVSGQPWYDNWVNTSIAGGAALRAKESSIVNYFNTLNIDYRALQKEVQLYIKDVVKDPSVTFPYWLNQSLYKTMTINLEDGLYSTYGISPDFAAAYNEFKAAVAAWNSSAQYHVDYLQLMFTSPTTMTLRMAFTAAGGGTQYAGDFDFSMDINPDTGEITFAKVANGTGNTYNNGALFNANFVATIQAYLTGKTFMGDWLPANTPANMFTKTAGLYEKNTPTSYFYGPLTQ